MKLPNPYDIPLLGLRVKKSFDHGSSHPFFTYGFPVAVMFSLVFMISMSQLFAQPCSNFTPVTNECVETSLQQKREVLRQLPEFQTRNADTHVKLATLLMQQGDPNGAIAEYQSAIQMKPEMAKAYLGLGAVYIDKHEWRKAEQALQKGLELNPQDQQGCYWLGRSFIAQEKFHSANQALKSAIQLDPKDPEAYSDLGLTLMAQGQGHEAQKALEHAITLQPDFAEAHDRLERVRAARDNSDRLIRSSRQILEILFRRE